MSTGDNGGRQKEMPRDAAAAMIVSRKYIFVFIIILPRILSL